MLQALQQLTWTITETRARANNGCLADPLLALQDPRQRTAPPRSSLPGAAFLSAAMCLRAVTRTPRPPVTPASRRSQLRGPPPPSVGEASRLTPHASLPGTAEAPRRHFQDRVTEREPARPRSLAPRPEAWPWWTELPPLGATRGEAHVTSSSRQAPAACWQRRGWTLPGARPWPQSSLRMSLPRRHLASSPGETLGLGPCRARPETHRGAVGP